MNNLWIFDFDGTLVDSEKPIKLCYHKVTQELIPERLDFVKKMIIGPTLTKTVEMILTDKHIHLSDIFKEKFQDIYDEKYILKTMEYPNTTKVLKKLIGQNDKLSIATNKRAKPTNILIKAYGWNNFFQWIDCMDENPQAKSKYDLLQKRNLNNYKNIYFVGDTLSDGIVAKELKIKFVRANYGYGLKENWKNIPLYAEIDQIEDLENI